MKNLTHFNQNYGSSTPIELTVVKHWPCLRIAKDKLNRVWYGEEFGAFISWELDYLDREPVMDEFKTLFESLPYEKSPLKDFQKGVYMKYDEETNNYEYCFIKPDGKFIWFTEDQVSKAYQIYESTK